MIQIHNKKLCTGCSACVGVCPVECIVMKDDDEGFLYPNIDKTRCISCGKCELVCPVSHAHVPDGECIAYAARTLNDYLRRDSSSGGIFSEIAKCILNRGGVVFGATFAEDFSVKHICIDSDEHLAKLRGSKYVQSRIDQTYIQARLCLSEGIPVLFTGTPCQIAGLYHFLGREYENLYTQDIICHGTPSPKVWKEYIKFREEKAGAKTTSVSFRDKTNGWRSYNLRFEFQNGAIYSQPISKDVYMQSFLKDLCLRPSCYSCAFKTKQRCADITLADFWGIHDCNPNMDDNIGTSLVIIHSTKGRELFGTIAEKLQWDLADIDKAIKYNPSMIKAVSEKKQRRDFIQCVLHDGFTNVRKKYLQESTIICMKRKVKSLLRRVGLQILTL